MISNWNRSVSIKSGLLFGLLALMLIPSASVAAAEETQRQITVIGQGEIRTVPDIAIMSIGVETEAASPSAALADNRSLMIAAMAKLKEAGIADQDMQTRQLGVWPIHGDRRNPGETPRIVAYRVSNQLGVTLREIERIGEILDQAVADGANTINGPTFSVADPAPLMEAARDAAVADAMAKAERYAAAAKVELGDVLSISESGGGPPVVRQMRAEAMAASTPIAAGESTFSASVTMVFAID